MPSPRDIQDFKLERFFDKYEFNAPYLLCCSDCEALTVQQVIEVGDADSLSRWKDLKLTYGDTRGLPALREAIAGLYIKTTPDQLVVCAPEEGVYLTMNALLRPGDHVVCTYPGYQSLYELAQSKGCEVSWWEPVLQPLPGSSSSSGGSGPRQFQFLLQDLKAALRPDTRLVVVNFPHNPTGATLSASDWHRLVELVKGSGAYLFSDEMYKFTELSPGEPLPSAADSYECGITLCGVSKSWGLPGLRIGWIASPCQELLARISALKDYTTICNSVPSEVLSLMAIRATPQLTARARAIISTNLDLAHNFFTKWADVFEWLPPQGGPICFPRLRLGEVNVGAWCQEVVEECGVLLLPATVYEHGPSVAGAHFRLGLGRSNFGECLKVLEGYLQKKYRQQS